MSLPVCPKCKSARITTGYPLDAGANRCDTCGHVGPVAEFHADPVTVLEGYKPYLDIMARDLVNLPMTVVRGDKTPKPVVRRTIKPHRELKVHPIPKQWWQD